MNSKLFIGLTVLSLLLFSCNQKNSKRTNVDSINTSLESQEIPLDSSYSTDLYSISYPNGWETVEQLNDMTEVYIGSQRDNFGFTIVRFETDYSLAEVNAVGNENIKQVGYIKVVDEQQITIDGVKCYRAIHEITLKGQTFEQISFTFKKGRMLYNIKFGSATTKSQEDLADRIVDSFRFK